MQGASHGLIGDSPGIFLEGLRKTTEKSHRMAALRGEILTQDLLKKKQGC